MDAIRTAVCVLALSISGAVAQTPPNAELEQLLKILRLQGMEPEQLDQFERRLRAGQALEIERTQKAQDADRLKVEQREKAKARERAELTDTIRAEVGQLNFGIGQERFKLALRSCQISPNRTGNLMELTTVFASGVFRGSPALVSINESHPVGSPQNLFQQLEIWLAEIKEDEHGLSLREILKKRDQEFQAWHAPKQKEIMESLQVNDEMSMDEINEQMEAQRKAYDSLGDEAERRRLRNAIAHGEVRVVGNDVIFESPRLTSSGSGRTPDAFFDLEDSQLYVVASCQ